MRGLNEVLSAQEWFELEQKYAEVIGGALPRSMLPGDGDVALALIKRVIETGDESLLEEGIPEGAFI